MQPNATSPKLIAASTIIQRGDFSESYFYAMVRRGEFPAPVMKMHRLTRWLASDVDAWFENPKGWIESRREGALA